MRIEFGEWLPDLRDALNPGATEAKNCIPLVDSYTCLKDLQSFTNALTAPCVGSGWFTDSGDNVYNFAGDSDDLYRLLNNNTWDEISKTTGAYNTATNWELAKFGDRVIAVNVNDAPQYYDMGTSSIFADLPGAPPQAARIAVVRDFVVLGDLSNAPNTIQWSGFNNSELWTASRATQSDSQELFGNAGKVQRIVPGEYGVVFQEHSLRTMTYVGPPTVFRIDEVERGSGTPSPNSVVWFKNLVFYYGWDGFYVFDGQKSIPISDNKNADWIEENLDPAAVENMRGVYDRQNGLVFWAFSSSGTTVNNRIAIYNIKANRWAYGEVNTQHIAEFATSGYNLDTLTSSLGLADIDTASFRMDSSIYKGGALNIIAFDSSNQGASFDGAALTATLTTKEIGEHDKRLFTRGVRPLVEGAGATASVRIGTREKTNGNVTYTMSQAVNDSGIADVRKASKYNRYEVSISGGFDHAYGVDVEGRLQSGRR